MVAPSSTSPPPCYLTKSLFIQPWFQFQYPVKTPFPLFSPSFYTPLNPFSGIEQWLYLVPGSLSLTQGRDMWQNKAEMYQKWKVYWICIQLFKAALKSPLSSSKRLRNILTTPRCHLQLNRSLCCSVNPARLPRVEVWTIGRFQISRLRSCLIKVSWTGKH